MKNPIEKNTEHEMETGLAYWCRGLQSTNHVVQDSSDKYVSDTSHRPEHSVGNAPGPYHLYLEGHALLDVVE